MKEVGVRGEEAEDKARWTPMIHCGDPLKGKPKGKKMLQ
jgi:hypothetical protein